MESPRHIFFSIVIPAHNEEDYIGKTLQKLDELDYPKDRFEVIVVENGSTDKTFDVANTYASSRVRVVSIKERGVSRARNHGSTLVHPSAEWVFFMDADISADPPFLRIVDRFIQNHASREYVGGTCALRPQPSTPFMEFLHFWMNIGFAVFGGAFGGALMVRRDILDSIRFDEHLEVNEDTQLSAKLRKMGAFFFLYTPYLRASTRRFQNGGLQKIPGLIAIWALSRFLPVSMQRRFTYMVKR